MFSLRGYGVVLVIGTILLGLFVAAMAIFGGCRAPLPLEPPFVETVAGSVRDR